MTSFYTETISAGRGVWALLRGRPDAGRYFDLGLRGLVGSFIALLLAAVLSAILPALIGRPAPWAMSRDIAMLVLLLAFQIAATAMVLRQIQRFDALVPYLVGDNWSSFFTNLIVVALTLVGASGSFVVAGLWIVGMIIKINVARILATLKPGQIILLIIAQIVGVFLALITAVVTGLVPYDMVAAPA